MTKPTKICDCCDGNILNPSWNSKYCKECGRVVHDIERRMFGYVGNLRKKYPKYSIVIGSRYKIKRGLK